jgi:hypothetical protein
MISATICSGRVGLLSRQLHFVSAICTALLLLQLLIFAQIGISSDDKLADRLMAVAQDESTIDRLLNENASLVTGRLWEKLIGIASREYYSNSDKALRIYQVAIKVGHKLNDKRLVATTYYKLGQSYSGLAAYSG